MLYNLAIVIYDLLVHFAAPFSRKPRKMMKGHWVVYELLRQQVEKGEQYIWFHAASLGEFEQGRPLIEMIREKYPDYKILLTFFSPSGYEVRKHYRGADIVCYLPFDKPRNVKKFLDIANPCMAFFIKYEFWKNYLDELHKRRIPVYSVSSIFRRDQIFFKWYGGTYRNVLKDFDHLFVQNEASKRYLSKIGISRVTVVGDTRFDRVLQIREEAKDLPLVKMFKGDNAFTFVAGSSWGPDEDLFLEYFNTHPEMKLIIAPHVIDENHLVEIISKLKRPYVRYTRADEKNVLKVDCLIIDCFGLLSSIYRYGEVAYIGGGFGVGIHNTLEAAVYGIPVIFGPKYQKFQEAIHLLEAKGGFSIKSYEELKILLDRMLGGSGQPLEKSREFSDIELTILQKLLVMFTQLLREPWKNVVDISPVLSRLETNPQFAQVIAPSDMIAIVTLNMKIGDVEGMLNICLPFFTLEDVMDKLNTKYWFSTMQENHDEHYEEYIESMIRRVDIPIKAVLGRSTISVNDFLNLQVGDCIRLDSRVDTDMNVYVGNIKKFTALPGTDRDSYAVQITSVIREEE